MSADVALHTSNISALTVMPCLAGVSMHCCMHAHFVIKTFSVNIHCVADVHQHSLPIAVAFVLLMNAMRGLCLHLQDLRVSRGDNGAIFVLSKDTYSL